MTDPGRWGGPWRLVEDGCQQARSHLFLLIQGITLACWNPLAGSLVLEMPHGS